MPEEQARLFSSGSILIAWRGPTLPRPNVSIGGRRAPHLMRAVF